MLQFKNENDTNKEDSGEKETLFPVQKSKPIVMDRNQYSIGDTFTFEANSGDSVPGVKDDGIDIR